MNQWSKPYANFLIAYLYDAENWVKNDFQPPDMVLYFYRIEILLIDDILSIIDIISFEHIIR